MLIKILGPGCTNCHTLEKLTRDALTDLNLTAEVTSVTDYPTIVGYGVMSTPALVVNEHVVLAGRIPTAAQLRDLLTNAAV
ncbi:MAG: thioredoxin family protein [Actinomycetota bacterium]|nr:thioredoxin family protein [Actinomycetota bacterium]